MDLNSQRRKIKLRYLYKRYKSHLKNLVIVKKKALLVNNSNKELHTQLIRLKEMVQEVTHGTSNFRTDIEYLEKQIIHKTANNQKFYNALASIRKNIASIEKGVGNVVKNSGLKSRLVGDKNLMPAVTNNVTTMQNVTMQPGVNYPRYNFKGCNHTPDLSPIMEEIVNKKQLNKPPDITRRLGHRGKGLQQHKLPESLDASQFSTLEGAAEANSVNRSPCPNELVKDDIEKVMSDTEAVAVENGLVYGEAECPSSLVVSNGLTNIHEKESIEEVPESPVVDVNLSQQPDCEKACNEDTFLPSIFANVFPRRRKRNDTGISLTIVEGSEEEPNCELSLMQGSSNCDRQLLNGTEAADTNKSSHKVSDISSIQSMIGLTDTENDDLELSAADKSSINERALGTSCHRLVDESSFDTSSKSPKWDGGNENSPVSRLSVLKTNLSVKDSIIAPGSSTAISDETSKIIDQGSKIIIQTLKMIAEKPPRPSKRISTKRSDDCSPKEITSPRKKQDNVSVSPETLCCIPDQRSVGRFSQKEFSISIAPENNQRDKLDSYRPSAEISSRYEDSLKLSEGSKNLGKSPSSISIDMVSEIRQEDRASSERTPGRISDHSHLSSGKRTPSSQVQAVKKTLRSRKPNTNFAESPFVNDKKRHKKKKKKE